MKKINKKFSCTHINLEHIRREWRLWRGFAKFTWWWCRSSCCIFNTGIFFFGLRWFLFQGWSELLIVGISMEIAYLNLWPNEITKNIKNFWMNFHNISQVTVRLIHSSSSLVHWSLVSQQQQSKRWCKETRTIPQSWRFSCLFTDV